MEWNGIVYGVICSIPSTWLFAGQPTFSYMPLIVFISKKYI